MTPYELGLKRRRLLIVAAMIIAALLGIYLLGTVLLTVGVSIAIAYGLGPVMRLIERILPKPLAKRGLHRTISITFIFVAIVVIFFAFLAAIIPPTVEQAREFADDFPDLLNSARLTIERWTESYAEQVPEDIRAKIESFLASSSSTIGSTAWGMFSRTLSVFTTSFSLVLGLATAPLLVFYLLKDSDTIKTSLANPFPHTIRPIIADVLNITDRTLGNYIRGQLTLGLIVGGAVGVALFFIGVPFAFLLGIVAGLTELVPIIGPWIGAAAGILVTLAVDPTKLPYVIALYLGVQVLENMLLVPRIQSDSLGLHPVVVVLVIIIASSYFGLGGVILGPPLVGLVKDLAVYFAEEWKGPGETPAVEGADPQAADGGSIDAPQGTPETIEPPSTAEPDSH